MWPALRARSLCRFFRAGDEETLALRWWAVGMTAVPLGEARDRLSEFVAEVERTHERITITRHGHPAAVLISADDLASIEETLEILGTPGVAGTIQEGRADADADAGRFANNDEIKARYGVA